MKRKALNQPPGKCTFPAEGCRYGLSGAKADPKVDLWEPWLELLA